MEKGEGMGVEDDGGRRDLLGSSRAENKKNVQNVGREGMEVKDKWCIMETLESQTSEARRRPAGTIAYEMACIRKQQAGPFRGHARADHARLAPVHSTHLTTGARHVSCIR